MSRRATSPYRIVFSLSVAVAISAGSSFAALPQAAETKPAIERVTADTPRVTSAGATFKVPAGWSIETGKEFVILTPPETDTHIVIVDSQAADAKAAVAAAWAAYKPESKRPIKLVTPRPAREGWEERQVFDYETSPNERAVVQSSGAARREALDRGHPGGNRPHGGEALGPDWSGL